MVSHRRMVEVGFAKRGQRATPAAVCDSIGDDEIRRAYHGHLAKRCASQLVVDELGLLQGEARVDLAVLSRGCFAGFEIKSGRDNLKRLARQVECYGRVLDSMTLITTSSHLAAALALIPEWWGVEIVHAKGAALAFKKVRPCKANGGVDTSALVQLLWRDEVLSVISALQTDSAVQRLSRRQLWQLLSNAVGHVELREIIVERLRSRVRWRSASPPE